MCAARGARGESISTCRRPNRRRWCRHRCASGCEVCRGPAGAAHPFVERCPGPAVPRAARRGVGAAARAGARRPRAGARDPPPDRAADDRCGGAPSRRLCACRFRAGRRDGRGGGADGRQRAPDRDGEGQGAAASFRRVRDVAGERCAPDRAGRAFRRRPWHAGGRRGPAGPFAGISFHPGIFPHTAAGLEDLRFSFVHLDLDLPEGTRAALEFFHPRLLPGGILLGDDYADPGVRETFESFFGGKPETLIALPWSQGMIVKR
ncbi:TylF/MycF/NovP-related O-methyltransferase [Sphingomonas sp. 7/4-4]|uniref:TylF/MycF/NovP-related O-methyltransferase n=1 Tax=Sphingomonas sp. 7/4-4 TaxID=3018446 RepID=UPI003FA7C538